MARVASLPKPIKSRNPVVILRHVIKAIKEEPKRYDQWLVVERRGEDGDDDSFGEKDYFPSCGTVACVGGWVNILTKAKIPDDLLRARRVLRLTEDEAGELFAAMPDGMRNRGTEASPRQHAADGIKHIKRFVLKKWGKKI